MSTRSQRILIAFIFCALVAVAVGAQGTNRIVYALRVVLNGNTLTATAGSATVTVPNATDTLVGKATTDTLTNKTIDTAGPNTLKVNGNTLAASAGSATLTFPNATQTILGTMTICTTANWCQSTTTLTDAQIKALPTTSLSLIAAPGASKRIHPLYVVIHVKATAGAYTNINAAASLGLFFPVTMYVPTTYIPNDTLITTGSTTRLTDLIGTANNRFAHLMPFFDTEGVDGWGPVTGINASTLGVNDALYIYGDNAGSGNFTGGNAANSMTIFTTYIIVTVP